MTDFEFLKGRFQMFFGFILAFAWVCMEVAGIDPSTELRGFIIGINGIFIAANSPATALVGRFIARSVGKTVLKMRRDA